MLTPGPRPAWPGQGQGLPEPASQGPMGGGGAGEPGPRPEAAPVLTIYGRSHTLPSSFSPFC